MVSWIFFWINTRKTQLLETYILFPVFVVLLLIITWLVTSHMIQIASETAEHKAADSARELVELYEVQMVSNLRVIDQTLKTVKYAYEQKEQATTLAALENKSLLPPKLLFAVSITNKTGEVIESNSTEKLALMERRPDLNDQHIDNSDVMVSSVMNMEGDPKIQFSRRLNDKENLFRGFAIVSVDPDYFTSGYERSRLGDKGVLGVVSDDGTFLVKRSGEQVSIGEDARTLITKVGASKNTETILELHSQDGVERYINARKLFGFPLTVIVGLSKEEQLETFRQKRNHYLWAAGIVSVLLLVMGAMLTHVYWQLVQSRRRTRKNEETYYAASEASIDAFFLLHAMKDGQGNIVDFVIDDTNSRGAQIFEKTKAGLIGARLCEVAPECRENGILAEFVNVYQTGILKEEEFRNNITSIHAQWLYRHSVRVEDGIVVILRDISERKTIEARISHMAHHDALTGLPNRILLEDRLNQAMLRARRQHKCVTIAFIDLDGFKPVNDTYGHKIGDELLKIVAARMVKSLRQADTVARLGGDEFIIVLGDQEEADELLEPTLERIRNAIAEPILIDGYHLHVNSSMGLVKFPRDGQSCDTLLINADAAMYQVKARGRNSYLYYEAWMNARKKA